MQLAQTLLNSTSAAASYKALHRTHLSTVFVWPVLAASGAEQVQAIHMTDLEVSACWRNLLNAATVDRGTISFETISNDTIDG
jgi:hypothetical protein